MSTFTEWNGVQSGSGPSVKQLADLIAAYETLTRKLTEHIESSASSEAKPHNTASYVEGEIATVNRAIAALEAELRNKAPADNYALNSDVNERLENYYTKANMNDILDTKADQSALNDATHNIDINRDNISDLSSRLAALKIIVDKFEDTFDINQDDPLFVSLNGILKAGQYLIGKLHALITIDFTKWQTVAMQFAGTGGQDDADTNGLYVIGKLSYDWSDDPDMESATNSETASKFKGARAFIKYENGHPFDAIIDMTATRTGGAGKTSEWAGSIQAIISKKAGEWSGLKFHLVHATAYDGHDSDCVYLCMSADGLNGITAPATDDNINYSNLYVHACGINFLPLDDKATRRVSLVSKPIAQTSAVPTDESHSVMYSGATFDHINADSILDSTGKSVMKVTHTYDALDQDHREVFLGEPDDERLQFWRRPILLKEYEDGTIVEDKFATIRDMQSISGVPIGTECYWPRFEKILDDPPINPDTGLENVKMYKAVDVPEGWIPEDGTIQLSVDYPDLAPICGDDNGAFRVPLKDFCMIKARMDVTSENSDIDVVPVLNYQQLVTLLKALRVNLAGEISRSIKQDKEHSDAIAQEGQLRADADNVLLENDKRLAAKDIDIYNAARKTSKKQSTWATIGNILTPGINLGTIISDLNNAGGAYDTSDVHPASISAPSGETVQVDVPEIGGDDAQELIDTINQLKENNPNAVVDTNTLGGRVTVLETDVNTLKTNVETINTKIDTLTAMMQQVLDSQQGTDPGNGGNP